MKCIICGEPVRGWKYREILKPGFHYGDYCSLDCARAEKPKVPDESKAADVQGGKPP